MPKTACWPAILISQANASATPAPKQPPSIAAIVAIGNCVRAVSDRAIAWRKRERNAGSASRDAISLLYVPAQTISPVLEPNIKARAIEDETRATAADSSGQPSTGRELQAAGTTRLSAGGT